MSSDDSRISTEELLALAEPVHVDTLTRWEGDPYAGDVGQRALQSETFGQFTLVLTHGTDILYGADLVEAQRHQPDDDGMIPAVDLAAAGFTRIKAEALADAVWANHRNSTVDSVMLAELRTRIIQEDEQLAQAAGYDGDDLDALIEQIEQDQHNVGTGDGDPDEIPEPPTADPVTKPGDIWLLGPHRLTCGDSTTDGMIDGDLVVTDPPYGIDLQTDYKRRLTGTSEWNEIKGSYQGKNYDRVHGDDAPFDPQPLIDTGPCLLFGANHFCTRLTADTGTFHVWDKREELGSNMLADCEFWWSSWPSGPSRIFRHKWLGYMRASEVGDHFHPTQKPIALIVSILEDPRCPPGVVSDPYAGSGTTLIACEQTGRVCHAIELSPAYCDVIAARYERATNIKPIREATGEPVSFMDGDD